MLQKRKCTAYVMAFVLGAAVLSGCGGKAPSGKESGAGIGAGDTQLAEGVKDTPGGEGTEDIQPTEIATEIPAPEIPEIISDEELEDYGGVVRVGDAVYELYSYVEEAADIYAASVNKAAENLSGKAQVYDVVVPLGSGIVFPDNLRGQINSSDQRDAIQALAFKMDGQVNYVDIYDALMQHRDEYIYFRTDHHWTALGAYYAYREFCAAKGITPEEVDSYETTEFDGFLGTFYNDTNKNERLGANPDVVTAYIPNMDAVCHVEDANGVKYDSQVIYNETNAPASLKYSAFIAGDNPYTEIVNGELTDGSSCIVIKDSFGNAFTPFLVDHYQTIYVVDFRYWTGSVTALAEEKGVDDVIFVNNLSMIRNSTQVGKLFRII